MRWVWLLVGLGAACSDPSSFSATLPSPGDDDDDMVRPGDDDDIAMPPASVDIAHSGASIRSAAPSGGKYVVLYDVPVDLKTAWGAPSRSLGWLNARGTETATYAPAATRQLIDVAVHASGDVSVLEASDDGWWLVRLTAEGETRSELRIADDAIATDPPALLPTESTSPIELVTHDAGRIAADGEGLFVGTRTGRHSVIAYRATWNGAEWALTTRTLVVPAHSITPTALSGGSYHTFGQLDAHYGVFVGVDESHTGYVGVSHAHVESGAMVKAFDVVFGEELATDPDYLDAFVARVDPDGKRLGTSVVSTPDDDELYALRSTPDGVFALGRVEHWNAEGTGFDALAAHVDGAGTVVVRTLDVHRGDIAFDAIADGDDLVITGTSGYVQNPNGASITEEGDAFARRWHPDGTSEAIAVPAGIRHNEARFVFRAADGRLVIGGMLNGPGTHSADGDPTKLAANGWLRATLGYSR